MTLLHKAALVLGALAATEGIAWFVHRHVMHGFGWRWHRSHHQPGPGPFEANDRFALLFSAVVIVLFAAGFQLWPPLTWIALGVTFYGVLYLLVHDMLVHRRFGPRIVVRNGYLKRLVQAHHLHHAVSERDGAVAFGFLWAPHPARLAARLRAKRPPS
jgi:beta-carotene 3-hydroxylase